MCVYVTNSLSLSVDRMLAFILLSCALFTDGFINSVRDAPPTPSAPIDVIRKHWHIHMVVGVAVVADAWVGG